MGLGWDPAKYGKIDIDASVIVFDRIGSDLQLNTIVDGKNNLMFGSKIEHYGDSGDGKGLGDDERIDIWLNLMNNDDVDVLCILITICSGAKSFENIKNCFVRLLDDDARELCKFNLSGNYMTRGVVMCTISKQLNGCWIMRTAGVGVGGMSAKQSVQACRKVCMGQHLNESDKQTDECCVIL